jgi:hypothetical protein
MTIKQQGGIFGRNPTFNDVTIDGTLTTTGAQSVDELNVDNLNLDGNTISTTDTNGNVILSPDGSGKLDLRADITMPKEVNREFSIAQSDPNDAGANLTIKAGNGGTGGASVHGGDLLLYAGDTWSGDSNYLGGDVKIYSGGNVVQNGQHGSIYFYVKGTTHTTEAARFNPSGNLAFPSGQGIDFSATSGTGTSELFSDYEEGSFTPYFESSGATFNNNTFSGTYTKVGRLVHIHMSCNFPTGVSGVSGTTSNTLFIKGLPYTPTTTGSGNVAPYKVDYPTGDWLYPQIRSDGSIRLYMIQDNNYYVDWTAAAFNVSAAGAPMSFALTGTYTAD